MPTHRRWNGPALAVIVLAVAAALVPLPSNWVERFYSTSLYPFIQQRLTALSNVTSFALFDVLIVTAMTAAIVWVGLDLRSRRHTLLAVVMRFFIRTMVWTAAFYLGFLVLWGLNYQREKLTARLQFDAAGVSPDAAVAAAITATEELNGLHPLAHQLGWRPLTDIDPVLSTAFHSANRDLGARTVALAGRPKMTLLDPYFRRAGVEGMTDPYFLETLVQSDLLPFERPFVVAHEWSHLAGFADESEASFVGWLTCLRGSQAHQYSGWLFLYSELVRSVRPRDRAAVTAMLANGPRADLVAIATRYQQRVSPRVSAVGWRVYDKYLKANRIESGTASYNEVVRLVLGVRFGPDWRPVLR